ncbi:MAG: hypothetical protein RL339_465 [Pseudomonadota bacterium]
MRPAALLTALAALALAGCGKADNYAGPGGVSVGEAKALDEAAQMLDAQQLPAGASPVASAEPSQSAPPAKP